MFPFIPSASCAEIEQLQRTAVASCGFAMKKAASVLFLQHR
jgi:hypothetical protein